MGATTRTDQVLNALMQREGEEMSVAQIAEATGLTRREVAVIAANSTRRRSENAMSRSPWRQVRRTAHGYYQYGTTEPGEGTWTEVGRQADKVVLADANGRLYVATRLVAR